MREVEIREILSTATSTQSPNHKTKKKKNDISEQLTVNKLLDRAS